MNAFSSSGFILNIQQPETTSDTCGHSAVRSFVLAMADARRPRARAQLRRNPAEGPDGRLDPGRPDQAAADPDAMLVILPRREDGTGRDGNAGRQRAFVQLEGRDGARELDPDHSAAVRAGRA